MTEMPTVQPARQSFAPDTLVRTETGNRLHIAACPHLGSEIRRATPADRLAMEVCTWCRAELDGVGRSYFDDLADAMRAFGTYAGTERLIREALRFVTYDQIWIPHSRSYVALGLEGRGVAWFGKTYVVPTTTTFVELPDYSPGHGGGSPTDKPFGETCPVHFVARSLTGVCDLCD